MNASLEHFGAGDLCDSSNYFIGHCLVMEPRPGESSTWAPLSGHPDKELGHAHQPHCHLIGQEVSGVIHAVASGYQDKRSDYDG